VRIDDFNGGILLSPSTDDGTSLARVWKGCSQASSHATNAYGHPSVNDRGKLPEVVDIIIKHLEKTIYKDAGITLRDVVIQPPSR
jgi:hypothetical protein